MAENSVTTIGRYLIEREIGRGGMAVVYKAFDPRLDRVVAIKLIQSGAFGANIFGHIRERFEREAKALARLDHQNIIKVLDYGEHDGAPYLVMEYIDGVTLKEIRKPVRIDTAVHLLLPIADALDYVHQQGMLHRDVKPSNIMINKENRVILTDFGIVKWIEDEEDLITLTATGVGIGTPEYMSPEQGRGMKIDGRSDAYSLTIVFFELITGQKPYIGDTPVNVLLNQISGPIPDPRKIIPELNESVTRFLFRALAKKPENRYPSMNEYLIAFNALTQQSHLQPGNGLTNVQIGQRSKSEINRKISPNEKKDFEHIHKSDPSETVIYASNPVKDSSHSFKRKLKLSVILAVILLIIIGKLSIDFEINQEHIRNEEALLQSITSIAEKNSTKDIPLTPASNFVSVMYEETKISQGRTSTAMKEFLEQTAIAEVVEQEKTEIQSMIENTSQEAIRIQSLIEATAQEATKDQAMIEATEMEDKRIQTAALATAEKLESIEATAVFYKNLQVGDRIFFGRYEQDNILENGVEPIEWDIIDVSEGRAILISHFGLDADSFNKGTGKTNWADCSLRVWLNEGFYETAFTDEEKQKIVVSYLENPDNHIYGIDGGDYSYDKVYILSYYEAGRYLVMPDSRKLLPTDYAISHRAEVDSISGYAKWWLRTPGNFPGGTTFVYENGSLDIHGYNAMLDRIVIRPVIRIVL